MRILVTGSKGQVGHCLTEALKHKDGVVLLAVDKDDLDITNQDAVLDSVKAFKPTIIINAAAHTAVDKAEHEVELSYAINSDGPKFLAEAASAVGAAILHISTDYVFEGDKVGEYVESDATNPQGVYGASKLAGEIEVSRACDKHIIIRTAWVFGEVGRNFVKTIIRLGQERNELSIVGDQFGGPTYAGDIAKALIAISEKITSDDRVDFGVYHYSGLPHVSWCQFADVILDRAVEQEIIRNKPMLKSVTTEQYPTQAKRPMNSKMSTNKITHSFGIDASDWSSALDSINLYTD
ncbi:TPA: dTDP-4-dehydrorhamnose reductase [Vibrio harveyi]|uniref:dTDP-4-dehydrorhamnose reductase n=1 Tax=Vibrio harveyi TaxID=669 RepID=UPI00390B3454